jgi:pimeloyl-ACP methyl ester carboxylesterase
MPARRRGIHAVILLGLILAGCSPPLSIETLDQQSAYNRLNRSILSGNRLSETTLTVLRRHNLGDAYETDLNGTIATLHTEVVGHPEAWSELFALAELSYLSARREPSVPRYMAAAVYAYAFLFPDGEEDRPSAFDPRFRQACDLYDLALAAALTPPGGGEVAAQPARLQLAFGTIDIAVDESSKRWGGRELTGFVPTGMLEVEGMQNQYRSPGIGAAVAARLAEPATTPTGFQVAPRLRVPATMVLRIASPRRELAAGAMHGTLTVFNIFDAGTVKLGDRIVPLEYDQTAARAVSLAETAMWDTEISGFLRGTMLDTTSTRLVAIEPHRRGRMPVVLIHGTASSPFRWADLVNDLLEDERIREHFEFWVFSYPTGNPIPVSAQVLRDDLQQAVATLGGDAADPALGHMVLIGHSQGGLLAKMLVIGPGDQLWNGISRRPLDQLTLNDKSRTLIRKTLFPTPVTQVDRVIFIATPQRGSYVAAFSLAHLAGRLVTLPLSVANAGAEVLKGNADAFAFDPSSARLGSVYGMTPGSPFMKALAPVPINANVHVHSIIPVEGDGPVALGDDGVVKYESAHIEPVDSEKIVKSSHSAQSNPVTIEEVRRILLLQIAANCAVTNCNNVVVGQR